MEIRLETQTPIESAPCISRLKELRPLCSLDILVFLELRHLKQRLCAALDYRISFFHVRHARVDVFALMPLHYADEETQHPPRNCVIFFAFSNLNLHT